jgi:hypothetical protein
MSVLTDYYRSHFFTVVFSCYNMMLLQGPLAIISLSNFLESLLNPVKELYIHFTTGVTMIGFYHLDGDFWPWRHVESTKQGEFLFSCIHCFATSMDPS